MPEAGKVRMSGEVGKVCGGKGTPVPAPMVGKLLNFQVNAGDTVRENDVVAILEAMKMRVEVYAPVSGIVQETCGNPGKW